MTVTDQLHVLSCECGYTTAPQKYESSANQMMARHLASRRHIKALALVEGHVTDRRHTCHTCGHVAPTQRGLSRHMNFQHSTLDDEASIWATPMPGPWARDGLCAQTDPDAFFPGKGENPTAAKRVCDACPVKARCVEYALAHPALTGVWGGTTIRERQQLRKTTTTTKESTAA